MHHTGAGDANRDGGIGFLKAMESTGHEGIVADGICENHELGAAETVCVGS